MSEKSLDSHGRWRSRTVAFRASEEEISLINKAAAISGLTKQQYMINKLIHDNEMVIVCNPRSLKFMRSAMEDILSELVRICTPGEISEGLTETIELVARASIAISNAMIEPP